MLTGFAQQDDYRRIWVAPGGLRHQLLAAIDREIKAHRRHGNGRLVFKVNSLVDRPLVRALYRASRAGVKIDLIVRGACCLRPGVPGWSENIRVISMIGRFLEHSRIYYFGNGGQDEVYLGSADLMERNLDRRVEVVFPVEDQVGPRKSGTRSCPPIAKTPPTPGSSSTTAPTAASSQRRGGVRSTSMPG